MALKSKDQMKTVIGTADLSLRADPGEAFIIKDIKVYAASATYVTLKTEKTTVGYFRVDAAYGNHLAFPQQRSTAEAVEVPFLKNLLELLLELGIFKGYPVAEGETFLLQGANAATDIKVVIYDIYEPEDVKNTDPNGSLSSEYTLINYGDTGAAIAAAGDHLYDNPLNPAEFPSFPFGNDVPAKLEILLHGICASEVGVINATPALAIHTRYLKLVKDREVLFDEDRNGLLLDASLASGAAGIKTGGGCSVFGAFSSFDPRYPLIFDEPLLFEPGDELNIYLTVVEPVDGSTIAALDQVVGMIQTVRRAGAE